MLTYPDKHKFEQIRARWETVRAGGLDAAEMVGRREKPAIQQPVSCEMTPTGGGKFRRKLSHGFAFISHPLSQRKITPARRQATLPAPSQPTDTTNSTPTHHKCESQLAPLHDATPSLHSNTALDNSTTPTNGECFTGNVDDNVTPRPRPLLRSQTLSYIPRPVTLDSRRSTTKIVTPAKISSSPSTAGDETTIMQSNIPSPSPPLSEHRQSSPRQYLSPCSSQQTTHIEAGEAFAARTQAPLFRVATRSSTTPNLVKSIHSPPAAAFMTVKKTSAKKHTALPTIYKPVLQENRPTQRAGIQNYPQTQGQQYKRESLAVPSSISYRKSLCSDIASDEIKQATTTTPQPTRKRLSSQLAQQTPVTAKRVQTKEHVKPLTPRPLVSSDNNSPASSRLIGLRCPPSPTISMSDLPAATPSFVHSDLQRKTLGTPNGLGGFWRSSRALAVAKHEVRRLPRSYTFHAFSTQLGPTPPMPAIPEQYRIPSLPYLPNLTQNMAPVFPSGNVRPDDHLRDTELSGPASSANNANTSITPHRHPRASFSTSNLYESSEATNVRPATPSPPSALVGSHSTSIELQDTHPSSVGKRRPWSISDHHSHDSADVDALLQVKDYMPPLYWAGRFQSRFDQWRTDAMRAELDPIPRASGPLGDCKLNQEKLASCYILGQLRDLCMSNQAADSLWVDSISSSFIVSYN